MTVEGLISLASDASFAVTVDRLDKALVCRGIALILRLDHAAAAAAAGLSLRPLLLFLIGDPRVGTPFMQANPAAGIDLPLRLLVWETANGETWLGYVDPAWIEARHTLDSVAGVAGQMTALLHNLVLTAAGSGAA